jgi:Amidohydrolase family
VRNPSWLSTTVRFELTPTGCTVYRGLRVQLSHAGRPPAQGLADVHRALRQPRASSRLFVSRTLAGRVLLPSVYRSPPDLLAQEFLCKCDLAACVRQGFHRSVMKFVLTAQSGYERSRDLEVMATRKLSHIFRQFTLLSVILSGFCGPASAQDYDVEVPGLDPITPAATEGAILFQNVRVFDGNGPDLSPPSNLLVRGNTIERIAVDPIDVGDNVRTIAGSGRVLMPGLIDAHWHAFMAATPQPVLMSAEPSYLHHRAAQEAEATLMRGFTTIRDLGGPVFGLKRAIDEGIVVGPRIYPSGAFISQTSATVISASSSNCRGSRAAPSATPSMRA